MVVCESVCLWALLKKVWVGGWVGRWCLDCSALTGFMSGHLAAADVCSGHLSLQQLCAFGSSLVQQNLASHVFMLLVTVLYSFQCVWLWRLLVGLAWFRGVRVFIEPVGSKVVAGRQAVPFRVAVWLFDVTEARVCFETLATAVDIGSHIKSTQWC